MSNSGNPGHRAGESPDAGNRAVTGRAAGAGRRAVAVNAGRAAGTLSRALGKGGGTTVPGYLAERLDPAVLADLAGALPGGCVMVSGTNGKTTTARLLADSLRLASYAPIANREGSNLSRGLVGALMESCDRFGRPHYPANGIGVFELDEGALPQAVAKVPPRAVLLTNLFRDQLDRYFEVDFLRTLWERGLTRLPAGAWVVVNADDPQLAYLAERLPNPTLTFGLEDLRHRRPAMEHAADATRCPRCEHPLDYQASFYAHLGHYSCPVCGWARPHPDVAARQVDLGPEQSTLELDRPTRGGSLHVQLPLGGLHNAYNALAALAAAGLFGVNDRALVEAAGSVQGAFGRAERLELHGRQVTLTLAKNPSGFNATLRSLAHAANLRFLLLALNDAGPDGRDVSWIWDVDFEAVQPKPERITCSGRRAADLALRVEYAGLGMPAVREDLVAAFWECLGRVPEGERLHVVATYTAMWSLREALVRSGHLPPFWAVPAARPTAAAAAGRGHGASGGA